MDASSSKVYALSAELPSSTAPVLFIVGPTAVGKSALALKLARTFDGEILSADSRQVYRYMDIGTAKPSVHERAQVHHHLIDILDPDQRYSLALFLDLARRAIQDTHSRKVLPIVVGGTGQYIWALLEGWQVPRVPADPALREMLEQEAGTDGGTSLYQRLRVVDPQAADRIDPRNLRRVIRALEVYHSAGTPASQLRRKETPPYRCLVIGLTISRKALHLSIDRRVDSMMSNGLVDEVRSLIERGYSPDLPAMSSMGYKQIRTHLEGGITLEQAVQRTKYETHRFARQQHTWFRLDDPRIEWLEPGPETEAAAKTLVERFLNERKGL